MHMTRELGPLQALHLPGLAMPRLGSGDHRQSAMLEAPLDGEVSTQVTAMRRAGIEPTADQTPRHTGDRRTGTAYSARAATIPEVQPDDASSKMDFAASPTSPPRLTRAVSNGTSLPGLGLEDPAAFSPR